MKYKIKAFLSKYLLKLFVWLHRDSNYIKHVKREVPEWFGDEGPDRWIAEGTVELLAVLSSQGHSGGSIGFALQFFKTMARFKPWGPLTGEDHEWHESGLPGVLQNIRCSHVFKDETGAHDSQGKVFKDPEGFTYTNSDSRVDIKFPYTVPETPQIVEKEQS